MRLTALAACLLPTACATTTTAASPASTAPVARYGATTITLADVEAKASDELYDLQEKLHELRTQTAERLFVEQAIAAAAKKQGVTEDEWVAARLDKAAREPTEAELAALFDKAKARLGPEADFDAVRPQLRDYLLREQRAKKAKELFEVLKKEHGFALLLDGPRRPRKKVEATGPTRGAADAQVTIVVFADFECPYCSRSAQTVERVLAAYPGKVRLVYRHYPLSFHKKAPLAAEAAACANEQGRFWEYHDALYANQDALDPTALKAHAAALDLDGPKFESCLESGRMKAVVDRDMAAGEKAGVKGTPAYFINGVVLSGAQPEEEFKKLIDAELARSP